MEMRIVDWNWYRLNGFTWCGYFFWFFNTGMVIRSEVPMRQANGHFTPIELAMFESEKFLLEPKKQTSLLPRFEEPLASVGLKEGSCNDWEIKIPDEVRESFLNHVRFLQGYQEYKWENRERPISFWDQSRPKRNKGDIADFRLGDFAAIPEEIESSFLDFRFSTVLE